MAQQVGTTLFKGGQVFRRKVGFRHAAVHFQRADGCHQHYGVGLQPRLTAFDVQEFFRSEIGAETRLGDRVIAQRHGGFGRDDRIAAVCDVGERSAVDQRGRTFQRLHEVGRERVFQQRRHRADRTDLPGSDRFFVVRIADYDAGKPRFEVGDRICQTEHRHDFGSDGDIESVLARGAVDSAAQPVHDEAELPVVHVHAAFPGDAARVDIQGVALIDMIVNHRRKQVVCRADGVEIARKMQVDVFHGDDLRPSAAGCAALDAEHGTERRFPEGDDGVLADLPQSVGKPDGGRGLAFPRGGGRDRGHKNEFRGAGG